MGKLWMCIIEFWRNRLAVSSLLPGNQPRLGSCGTHSIDNISVGVAVYWTKELGH